MTIIEAMDKLEEIFRMQRELADIIDSNRYPRGIEYRISVLMTALIHEAVELQRLTPWKWWQIPKPMNEGHAREEAIDILHFLIQTLIELGMTPDDVLKEYKKKHKVNVDRQLCYKCGSKKELIGAGVCGNKGQAICSKCYVVWEQDNGRL